MMSLDSDDIRECECGMHIQMYNLDVVIIRTHIHEKARSLSTLDSGAKIVPG